jgi:hypothetical protein
MRHGNQLHTEEQILRQIFWDVKKRIVSKGRYLRAKENEEL